MVDIHIFKLSEVPQYGPLAMEWIYNTWGARKGRTVEDARAKASVYENFDKLPIMLIATMNDAPAGCVILCECDLPGYEQYSPWLASLYVEPSYRGYGVAQQLALELERVALNLGYNQIYLFTDGHEQYYKKCGWEPLITPEYSGRRITIMSKVPTG